MPHQDWEHKQWNAHKIRQRFQNAISFQTNQISRFLSRLVWWTTCGRVHNWADTQTLVGILFASKSTSNKQLCVNHQSTHLKILRIIALHNGVMHWHVSLLLIAPASGSTGINPKDAKTFLQRFVPFFLRTQKMLTTEFWNDWYDVFVCEPKNMLFSEFCNDCSFFFANPTIGFAKRKGTIVAKFEKKVPLTTTYYSICEKPLFW